MTHHYAVSYIDGANALNERGKPRIRAYRFTDRDLRYSWERRGAHFRHQADFREAVSVDTLRSLGVNPYRLTNEVQTRPGMTEIS